MGYQELKPFNAEDVQKRLQQAQARLQELRFKLGANQVTNVREVRVLRKDIARMQTYLQTLTQVKK